MQLKKIIDELPVLRYMVEQLELQSTLGKRYLLATKFMANPKDIETELDAIEKMLALLSNPEFIPVLSKIKLKLNQLHDIKGTLQNLLHRLVLDDIELFELKRFSLLCSEIKDLLGKSSTSILALPDLTDVLNLLDPEKSRVPSFYIYDCYSEELTKIRKEIKELKKITQNSKQVETLTHQSLELEDQIRGELSGKLFFHKSSIQESIDGVAYLDILIAKSAQAKTLHLSKPELSDNGITQFAGLFNPQVKEILEKSGKQYQAIDFNLDKNPRLITGANMSGKTVLLKTLALSQYLLQFGFYVPAHQAVMSLVDGVLLSIDNNPLEESGLSSFATEMLKINEILTEIKTKTNALVLIDELARTTNPYEGSALVSALLDIFEKNKIKSLITTHYSVSTNCRKMRVKGFTGDKNQPSLTPKNINDFMDYSLEETNLKQAPTEALHVAKLLGINEEFIRKAENYLEKKELE